MSRKKKKRKQKSPQQTIRFEPRGGTPGKQFAFLPGTPVRVRPGVLDPDFSDQELGGWTATVLSVDEESDPPAYELLWTEESTRRFDAARQASCEEEGLDLSTIWLSAADVELDVSRPLQDPTALRTIDSRVPPKPTEQETRVRAALGVPVGEQIPLATFESVRSYLSYLATRLVFPLQAVELETDDETTPRAVTLLGVVPIVEDLDRGVLVEIDCGGVREFVPLWVLTVEEPEEAGQMIEDYAFWFCTSQMIVGTGEGSPLDTHLAGRNPILWTLKTAGAYGALGGAATGALLATHDYAQAWLWVGMIAGGLLGYLAGARVGRLYAAMHGYRSGQAYGSIFLGLLGVMVGGMFGVFIVGALGSIPGAIAGSLIGSALAARGWSPLGVFGWPFVGSSIGGLVYAALCDRTAAFWGALLGAGGGALCLVLLVVIFLLLVGLAGRSQT